MYNYSIFLLFCLLGITVHSLCLVAALSSVSPAGTATTQYEFDLSPTVLPTTALLLAYFKAHALRTL